MFEFLFKYPSAVFYQGTFVLLSGWPMWVLGAGLVAGGSRSRLAGVGPGELAVKAWTAAWADGAGPSSGCCRPLWLPCSCSCCGTRH